MPAAEYATVTTAGESCSDWMENKEIDAVYCHALTPKVWDNEADKFYCKDAAHLRVQSCMRGGVRAIRFGPHGSVGQSWHYTMVDQLFGPLLFPDDRLTSFHVRVVDTNGHPYTYPPLHPHHIHVQRFTNIESDIMWMQVHGDYTAGQDGVLDYEHTYPHGYGIMVDSDAHVQWINVQSLVDDQRVRGSPNLDFYVEVSFTVATKPVRPATLVWLDMPEPELGIFRERRYDVLNEPSLSWWSGTMPYAGTALDFWVHVHRIRFHELIFLTTPRELAVPCRDFGIATMEGEHAISDNITMTRERFLGVGHLICRSLPGATNYAEISSPDVAMSHADRHGTMKCTSWKFEQGDHYTMVLFWGINWSAKQRHKSQHTELFMVTSFDEDPPFLYTIPSGTRYNECKE